MWRLKNVVDIHILGHNLQGISVFRLKDFAEFSIFFCAVEKECLLSSKFNDIRLQIKKKRFSRLIVNRIFKEKSRWHIKRQETSVRRGLTTNNSKSEIPGKEKHSDFYLLLVEKLK